MFTPAQKPRGLARMIFMRVRSSGAVIVSPRPPPSQPQPPARQNGNATPVGVASAARVAPGLLDFDLFRVGDDDVLLAVLLLNLAGDGRVLVFLADLGVVLLHHLLV